MESIDPLTGSEAHRNVMFDLHLYGDLFFPNHPLLLSPEPMYNLKQTLGRVTIIRKCNENAEQFYPKHKIHLLVSVTSFYCHLCISVVCCLLVFKHSNTTYSLGG